MSLLRGVLVLWLLLSLPGTTVAAVPTATGPRAGTVVDVLRDEAGPYAIRMRGADGRWILPAGDAVLLDEAWWTPLRPLLHAVVPPAVPDASTIRQIRKRVAPASDRRHPDRLTAVGVGDVTADGTDEVVLSFRRPFRRNHINRTRPRREWVDAQGYSAHLGLYDPRDLSEIWVAGTLTSPVLALAACDGALAVAYGQLDGPAIVETGAWRWIVFGFLPAEPLPGPGVPICVDLDGDGQSEPAIVGRSG